MISLIHRINLEFAMQTSTTTLLVNAWLCACVHVCDAPQTTCVS